ncbi:MAG: glycosyltransferase family 2 protein, partial [Acidimicrobiales bacterium]
MDARAPAVVAVLVTRDPGPWFETVLQAWARQDYPELSILVLVSGGTADPTPLVARHLPTAFVRRLDEDRGFGAAANHAASMVEGAAFFLLCHDDCAPDTGAVHAMVEESFRSNAGVVTPKMVRWDDPSVLLHVGMSADKTGAVLERVAAGEVDHGQHDAVRDVFVAPGGCTLIRADLFAELGGYDAGIVAMGEDLDLSWRVQIAGARVVVAPAARVRHLEELAGGRRRVAAEPDGSPTPSLQVLQRRHELRTVLKCYGRFHRARVLPQLVVLAVAEILAALVVRDSVRIGAVVGAFRWNVGHRGELRRLRKQLRAHRVLPDGEVRRLQVSGSARLSTYVSRLAHQGFDVAHGLVPATEDGPEGATGGGEPLLTGSVGSAFSEDADFDELDDLGRRAGRDRFGRRRRRPVLDSGRSRLVLGLVAALVLVVGSRQLLSGGLPLLGQFARPLDWGATWGRLFATW